MDSILRGEIYTITELKTPQKLPLSEGLYIFGKIKDSDELTLSSTLYPVFAINKDAYNQLKSENKNPGILLTNSSGDIFNEIRIQANPDDVAYAYSPSIDQTRNNYKVISQKIVLASYRAFFDDHFSVTDINYENYYYNFSNSNFYNQIGNPDTDFSKNIDIDANWIADKAKLTNETETDENYSILIDGVETLTGTILANQSSLIDIMYLFETAGTVQIQFSAKIQFLTKYNDNSIQTPDV